MKPKDLLFIAVIAIVPVTVQAYEIINETKYKTYDNKMFESANEASRHEEIQKNIDSLLEPFIEEIEKLKEASSGTAHFASFYHVKISEEKKAINEYSNTLYNCIKKLCEKGYEVEIKLTKKSEK